MITVALFSSSPFSRDPVRRNQRLVLFFLACQAYQLDWFGTGLVWAAADNIVMPLTLPSQRCLSLR